MAIKDSPHTSASTLSSSALFGWRIAQIIAWFGGLAIVICLCVAPATGLLIFWNILITAAPALFVIATGLWRNICPMATISSFPRRLGLSAHNRLPPSRLRIFNLVAVLALFLIVPLRHVVFDTSGSATAVLIMALAAGAIISGTVYEWKSAWCAGLCPIYPVERLYGSNVMLSLSNAQCDTCINCVRPCPDSTPNIGPGRKSNDAMAKITELLVIGGLPGFIWGWFQVPDLSGAVTLQALPDAYIMPMEGLAVTLAFYAVLSRILHPRYERRMTSTFAAAGVSCYYWYRLPALLGFGRFGPDGSLINLNGILPLWCIFALTVAVSCFFFYWLVLRERTHRSWSIRPPYQSRSQSAQ